MFHNILINLLITIIYYFIFISLFFSYIKSYLFIIENRFLYIILLKNISFVIQLLFSFIKNKPNF